MAIDYDALGRYLEFKRQQDAVGAYITSQAQAQIRPPAPTELAQWSNQRRAVTDAYGNSQAQNAFDRGQALSSQSYETGQLAKQWDRTREQLPGQFAHRGLLNSGIYGGALQQYGQDRASASSGLALKYQQQLGNIGLAGQRASTSYTSGIAAVDTTEAARRQELASQLAGVV